MDVRQTWEDIEGILRDMQTPRESDTLFLFGGGFLGSLAASILKDKLEITAICDNDPKKQGGTIGELPCISPQKLKDYLSPFVLISTAKHYSAIHKQLSELGIRHCNLDAYIMQRHFNEFKTVLQVLDDTSREIYVGILLCRITGDYSNAERWCCDNQYFCRPRFRYIHGEKGAFVDCGAFVGDTLDVMIKNSLGTAPRIYAFEPGEKAFAALRKRASVLCEIWAMESDRVVCEKMGVGEKSCVLPYFDDNNSPEGNHIIQAPVTAGDGVKVVSLDEYFLERGETNISFIKADIEGSEWDMLHGAKNTIRNCKPKLAICIYHSIFDFFRIPLYLKGLVPEYKFEVRHHSLFGEETVLYCHV